MQFSSWAIIGLAASLAGMTCAAPLAAPAPAPTLDISAARTMPVTPGVSVSGEKHGASNVTSRDISKRQGSRGYIEVRWRFQLNDFTLSPTDGIKFTW
jgi:hypothetical protein